MTAPTFRGSSSIGFVTSGNAPTAVSGQATGDALIGISFGADAFTQSTGWTDIAGGAVTDGNTGRSQIFGVRRADGTANDAWKPSYANSSMASYLLCITGLDPTTILDVTPLRTQWAGSSATVFPPSVTPVTADDLLIVIYAEGSGPLNVTTPPAGFTACFSPDTAVVTTAAYYKALSGQVGVAQGPINLVWSGSAYGPAVALLIRAVSAGSTYTLTAGQGSYTLTGQDVNFLVNRVVVAAQGNYALTGQTAALSYNTASVLTAGQGSYLLTGSDALVDTSMNADMGQYNLTGFAANLVYQQINAYTLVAAQGSYTLTGFASNLLESRVLTADKGQYNLTGQFNTMVWSGAPTVVSGQNRSINMSKLRIGL